MLKLLMLFLMTLNVLAWPRWAALSPVKVGEELRDGAAVLGWLTKLTIDDSIDEASDAVDGRRQDADEDRDGVVLEHQCCWGLFLVGSHESGRIFLCSTVQVLVIPN